MRNKQSKPVKYSGKYRNYSPDRLIKAYEAVKTKTISVHKAALQFEVPEATLSDRVKGNVNPNNLKNEETLFTKEEELSLVEHIEVLAQLGYGATNNKLKELWGDLAKVLGKKSTDNALSNNWVYGVLRRWNNKISSVKPSSLETSRARSATPEAVDHYFNNLTKVMQENELEDKPQFIYNLDETGINPEHRPPNIIAPLNGKAQSVTSPRSTTTTIIGCANAAGNHLPPYFIFKGKRLNPELRNGASPGSSFNISDSGWSNSEIFKDYLEHHFLPNVRRGTNDNQKILLLFDGHKIHFNKPLVDWAISRNLILFVLPAHTSHLLQPLDMAIYGPFKGYYYRECVSFMRENIGQAVTKYDMTGIACKSYLRAMCPSNIVSAFKKSGIYPLNREVVPIEKLFPSDVFRDTTPHLMVAALKSGKDAVDSYLQTKFEQTPKEKPKKTCGCQCTCPEKLPKVNKKPNPSGKDITHETYIEEVRMYEEEKENQTSTNNQSKKPKKRTQPQTKVNPKKTKMQSPEPSTSGLNKQIDTPDVSEYETDDITDDESEVCCVCNRFSPPNLKARPYLKIVSWGYCSKCEHSVHLSFCHEKNVIRRNDTFLCPHCV